MEHANQDPKAKGSELLDSLCAMSRELRVREVQQEKPRSFRQEAFNWAHGFTKTTSLFGEISSRSDQLMVKELLDRFENELRIYKYAIHELRKRHQDRHRALKTEAINNRYWGGEARTFHSLKGQLGNIEDAIRNVRVAFERTTQYIVSQIREVHSRVSRPRVVLPEEDNDARRLLAWT